MKIEMIEDAIKILISFLIGFNLGAIGGYGLFNNNILLVISAIFVFIGYLISENLK